MKSEYKVVVVGTEQETAADAGEFVSVGTFREAVQAALDSYTGAGWWLTSAGYDIPSERAILVFERESETNFSACSGKCYKCTT